ncbi:MAG TPA: aspartate/glutamate racemase family protein [Arthrobacter sp.]|nr:aspartate/glutamate racemase family protein [Nocardioidaceae bacterium]HET7414076.1 aspartate/glutamate racemase family protein [Arthrobacter sp.]
MRILVINPNTTDSMTKDILEAARRHALPGTLVEAVSAPWGPRSIEGHAEEALAAAATLEAVAESRSDYDGFVVACYGDPGLYAARELVDAPVMGIAESSMLMACTLAHKFSVVTVIPRIVPMLQDLVRRYGLESRCASVRSSGLAVLDIDSDVDAAGEAILTEARRAIAEDGAEAIALGCAGMGPLDDWLRERMPGVPVIDGVVASVKLLEGLQAYGLTTSKVRAFQHPEPKELVGVADALQASVRR